MELSDANLQTLTEYLKKTLDPDPTIRRPGKEKKYFMVCLFLRETLYNLLVCKFFLNERKNRFRFTLRLLGLVYF